MRDDQITDAFAQLDPTPAARTRIEARLLDDLDAAEGSLLEAWLDLVRARPLVGLAYAAGATAALVMSSPLAAVGLRLLLQ
jgi:hypothetical protein